MKKAIYTIFCFTIVLYVFPITSFANDFSDNAISVFQELGKLNEESRAAFLSGDMNFQKEKGELLTTKKDEFNKIVKSLPKEYCSNHQIDLLREYIKILVGTTDEYPAYVFAELYACDPDTVAKEIMALSPEENKIKIFDDLEWGFKNVKYKIESLPNYKELCEKLKKLKSVVRGK